MTAFDWKISFIIGTERLFFILKISLAQVIEYYMIDFNFANSSNDRTLFLYVIPSTLS